MSRHYLKAMVNADVSFHRTSTKPPRKVRLKDVHGQVAGASVWGQVASAAALRRRAGALFVRSCSEQQIFGVRGE